MPQLGCGKKMVKGSGNNTPTVLTAYIFEMNCNLKCWLLFWKVHQSWYQMLPTKRALWCKGNIQLRESNLCLPCLLCKLAEPVSLIGFELRGPERSFGDIEIEATEEEKNPILKNLLAPKLQEKKKKITRWPLFWACIVTETVASPDSVMQQTIKVGHQRFM